VIVPYLRGYGTTRFLSIETFRNSQQSALALDAIALMDALKIDKATLGGCDWGARTADIIAALWPERCKALVSVSGYLIGSQQAGKIPLPSKAELQWWRQFYFATDRGRAGYDKYRRDFARLIWQLASPKWSFDDATFDRSAAAFENPDHVAIVIHSYRWRLGLAEGEQKYDDLEQRLAQGPIISVPAITLEGNTNGAPHPEPGSYAKKLSGKYAHRLITGGVEHNLPQEAPNAVMIEAYKAGVPGNGQPFPDGSKIAKIEWKPKKSTEAPFYVRVPNVLQDVFFIEKNTKRFPDTNGWAYAQFNYDPPSDTFAPDGSGAKCGYACHTIVSGKDYIFTAYGKRWNGVDDVAHWPLANLQHKPFACRPSCGRRAFSAQSSERRSGRCGNRRKILRQSGAHVLRAARRANRGRAPLALTLEDQPWPSSSKSTARRTASTSTATRRCFGCCATCWA